MKEAKDVTLTSFGLIIAYLLPGLAGLFSLGFWSNSIKDLFQAFLTTQSSIGLFLLVITSSLIVGLEIGIIRWFIFEYLLFRRVSMTTEDYALLQSTKIDSFRLLVDELYRHSQFFGGMAVVIPLLYMGWSKDAWLYLETTAFVSITASVLALEALTIAATKVSYARFVYRAKLILKGETMSNGIPGPGVDKITLPHPKDEVHDDLKPATPDELAAQDQSPPITADASPKKEVKET